MPTGFIRAISRLSVACAICLGLCNVAAAEPPPPSCPLPPDSFLDLGPFRPAFAFPNEEADREIKVRASKNQQPGSALSCWKLLELRAHQSLAEQEGLAASSTTSQNVPMTCGWPGGRWSQATYWLTATELDGEQHACPKLRQDLLAECIGLVDGPSALCSLQPGGARAADGNLLSLLEAQCRIVGSAIPACPRLLERLKGKHVETPGERRARLALAGVSFGLGAVALALGVTQMFIPLGTSGSCPQSGIDYSCGPDRYGLGIPLAVGGGLLVAAGGALLAVKF